MATALGKNTKLFLGDGGDPEVFSQVLSCTTLKPPAVVWDEEDVSNFDDETPVKKSAPTMRDEGKLDFVIKSFDPEDDVHAALYDLAHSAADNNWKITYPGGMGVFPFAGFCTNFMLDVPVGGLQSASFSIKANGVPYPQALIAGVTITDSQAGDYVTGETVQIQVSYNEAVLVTGTPTIAITLASGSVNATYVSGSGTSDLKFSKTFGSMDNADADDLEINSPIALSAASIKDTAGNNAALTFTAPDTHTFTLN